MRKQISVIPSILSVLTLLVSFGVGTAYASGTQDDSQFITKKPVRFIV